MRGSKRSARYSNRLWSFDGSQARSSIEYHETFGIEMVFDHRLNQ